jgi:tetratricopeptide (TPR) repeat protein
LVREAKLVLSNICVQQDRYEDGVEWLEQVMDEYPRDAGALNDLGYLWSDKGLHPDRSLQMVKAAVEAEPENAAYQDSLGWALFRIGKNEQALKHLEKAVELQGEEVDGVILDHLGDVYDKLGRKEKAQDAWRRALAAFEKAEETEEAEKTKMKLENEK